ncbi:MAG: diaminopimelate epimerase [Bacteroidetes bacterium]|jgi:diaminopimelate epimerase|nr:diaminopimelate epimerase [Bacteroidota bacterium]|tara:strand:- start:1147 stop:1947 length:801 start_codon:yes stop_codon:yes gene_type:complete
MKIPFHKFQGNGNDFVIFDNRSNTFALTTLQVQKICNRRFGIGADGLILVNQSPKYDFEMIYYNSDGNESSMCGNGGRCIAAYTSLIGIVGKEMTFEATDGIHNAIINGNEVDGTKWDVSLQLTDVVEIEKNEGYYFLDTGSPHYVEFVEKVAEIDVTKEGRKTRESERFAPEGTNVNFVESNAKRIFVRTYERGVEEETLSCGTGVVASAIAVFIDSGKHSIPIHTTGGEFEVNFTYTKKGDKDKFTDIWLRGPAKLVFEGEIDI